ncbi:hypothetical protein [Chitinimonas koreensis]|uniref:hypothetical protein n=1 Tax=Chitinimonas koreensis TaxID=356302 RepID=UPI0012FA8350|nr:hypothetical protein [Chitinimonas koreensis]QNM95543.1 hypothetical protein H9L41_16960 [Chitinimonas koreensis]
MKIDYRGYARKSLQQAQQELQGNDDVRLRSAALQLRMAMEALTYDRMQIYADEISPEEYLTWQPKRVMELLLEIDAGADKDSSLALGVEEVYGVLSKEMQFLGTEKVLNMVTIKKHYDAMGSYLHMPTPKQMQEGRKFDADKLRARCLQIAEGLEEVLASRISNIRFATWSQTSCVYCHKTMRKRAPIDKEPVSTKCFECGALYRMFLVNERQVRWEPQETDVSCPTSGCAHTFVIGNHEIKLGAKWGCPKCGQRWKIGYCIAPDAGPQD